MHSGVQSTIATISRVTVVCIFINEGVSPIIHARIVNAKDVRSRFGEQGGNLGRIPISFKSIKSCTFEMK